MTKVRYTRCKTGKRRYRDEIAAKLAMASAARAGRDEKRAYKCGICRGWHVTSKEAKSPKALTTSRQAS